MVVVLFIKYFSYLTFFFFVLFSFLMHLLFEIIFFPFFLFFFFFAAIESLIKHCIGGIRRKDKLSRELWYQCLSVCFTTNSTFIVWLCVITFTSLSVCLLETTSVPPLPFAAATLHQHNHYMQSKQLRRRFVVVYLSRWSL